MRREQAGPVATTLLAFVLAAVGCGADEAAAKRVGSETFSVRGAVIIEDPAAFTTTDRREDGDECSGKGPAAEIDNGAQVLVLGSDGTEVGQGELTAGRLNMDYHATAATCSFEIGVSGVQQLGRAEVYTLRLTGHEVSFEQADANGVYLEVP